MPKSGRLNKHNPQNKTAKNLQMAKDLNREMEEMFAEDEGFRPARAAKKSKKRDKR